MERNILWDRYSYCGEIAVRDTKGFALWQPKLISVLPARVSLSFHPAFLGQLQLSWHRVLNHQKTLAFIVRSVLCWLTVLNTGNTGSGRHWSQHREETGMHRQGWQNGMTLEKPAIRLGFKSLKLQPILHLKTVSNCVSCMPSLSLHWLVLRWEFVRNKILTCQNKMWKMRKPEK